MPRVQWTQHARTRLRAMWYNGLQAEVIAIRLAPEVGHLCTPHTIIVQAARIKARRSKKALAHIRSSVRLGKPIYTRQQPIVGREPKPIPDPVLAMGLLLCDPIRTTPKTLPHIPYRSLATLGPDPYRAQRIAQTLEGARGRL